MAAEDTLTLPEQSYHPSVSTRLPATSGPISAAATSGNSQPLTITPQPPPAIAAQIEDAFGDVKAGSGMGYGRQMANVGNALVNGVGAIAKTVVSYPGYGLNHPSLLGTAAQPTITAPGAGVAPPSVATPSTPRLPFSPAADSQAASAAGGGGTLPPPNGYNINTGGQPVDGLDNVRKLVDAQGRVTYTNVAGGPSISSMAPSAAPAPGTVATTPSISNGTDLALTAARQAAVARGDTASALASFGAPAAQPVQTTPTIIGSDPRNSEWNRTFDASVAGNRATTAINLNPGRRGAAMADAIVNAFTAPEKLRNDVTAAANRESGETQRAGMREAGETARTTQTNQTRLAGEQLRIQADSVLRNAQALEAMARGGSLMSTLAAQQEHAAAINSGDPKRIERAEEKLRGVLGKFERSYPDVFKTAQIGGGVDEKTGLAKPHGVAVIDAREGNVVKIVNGDGTVSSPGQPAKAAIPQGAIDMLKANPSLAAAFDAKYGKDASKPHLTAK